MANYDDSTVTELNASTGAVIQTIDVTNSAYGVSSDGTHVWVANSGQYGDRARRLDRSRGPDHHVGISPIGVSSDGTHVWVANYRDDTVTELNASTGAVVQTIAVGNGPDAVSSDGTHVWVTNYRGRHGHRARRLDRRGRPDHSAWAPSPMASPPTAPTSGWRTSDDDTVTELDASTGAVVQTINVGNGPIAVSSDGTHVWVTNLYDNTVTEIAVTNGPLQIATTSLPDATVGQPYSFQLQATGGTAPYTWNKYLPKGRGALPPRLSISKGGLISGTPKKAGTYTIIVKCLQATAHPNKTLATQVLTLTVDP